jgi:hypothetical protein
MPDVMVCKLMPPSLVAAPPPITQIKHNPGWYIQSDNRDYHGNQVSQNQTEMNTIAAQGAVGSPWLGYMPGWSWGTLETTAGNYSGIGTYLVAEFNYLQSVMPGGHYIPSIYWSISAGGGGFTNANGNEPLIPSDILNNVSTYGAGPPGTTTSGWGLSGYGNPPGAWQLTSAAMWVPAVYNRWVNFLSQLANYSFLTTAGPYSGQTFTFDTHPLIEMIVDPNEDSWDFWNGPAVNANYSDSALTTGFQTIIAGMANAFPHTRVTTYQSYGYANDGFPDPSLPPLIGYAGSHRNAMSNADTYGAGISAVSAHEIFCGNVWNGSSWVPGGTDYRNIMAYVGGVQGSDYHSEVGSGGGTIPGVLANIYATMQALQARYGILNIWDDQTLTMPQFVSTYLTPFANANPIPNITRPSNGG